MAFIAPALGAIGSIVGGSGGKKAQQQASNAAQQDANAMTKLFGAESSDIDALMKQYFGTGGAAQGSQNLQSQLAGWLANPSSNPANAALTTQLGNQGASTVKTLQGDIGGVANPGALATSLFGNANQAAKQAGSQFYADTQGQDISGLSSLFGQQAGLLGTGLSGQQSMANTYAGLGQNAAQMAAGQGNPWSSALGSLGNSLGGLAGLFSGSSGGAGSGASGLNSLYSGF